MRLPDSAYNPDYAFDGWDVSEEGIPDEAEQAYLFDGRFRDFTTDEVEQFRALAARTGKTPGDPT